MAEFKNPFLQEIYNLYEDGEIDKAEYLKRLREYNLSNSKKPITTSRLENREGKRWGRNINHRH